MSKGVSISPVIQCAIVLAGLLLASPGPLAAEDPAAPKTVASQGDGMPGRAANPPAECETPTQGSPFIPVDSWVYPAVLRLYSMNYVDPVFLGLRPWTRASLGNMLEDVGSRIEDANEFGEKSAEEAQEIYGALTRFLRYDPDGSCLFDQGGARAESVYSTTRAMTGTPLRDSYHLGSTIVNDYGRPYASGLNNYSGVSGYATAGRFLFYARGEFQGAPSATGYSTALAQALSVNVDNILFAVPGTKIPNSIPYSQPTIPLGPISSTANGRLLEAYVSTNYANHIFSFGKQDEWMGPAQGGSFAYSNNAENIYALHINRIEPLDIPVLSRLTGPFRYEFLVGALKGHTYVPATAATWVNPGAPWVHVEKFNFKPTPDLEFGFERTVIWGGKGHEGISLHSFLRSFFSLTAPDSAVKDSNRDPGARFASWDVTYRLPYLRKWLTFYTDSDVRDDVSPPSAFNGAAWRPGLYLSHVPGIPKLDIRAEGAYSDPPTSKSNGGRFIYYEAIERQGYTNNGQIFGDWIGREDKGGQAWVTYHLSANEWIQASLRNQKASKDFIPGSPTKTMPGSANLIPGGTTLNDFDLQVVKRIRPDFEVNGKFTLEHWKAPIYMPGLQTVTSTTIQLTWFPEKKIKF